MSKLPTGYENWLEASHNAKLAKSNMEKIRLEAELKVALAEKEYKLALAKVNIAFLNWQPRNKRGM